MTEIEKPREREAINTTRSDTYVARIFLQSPDALNPDRPLTEINVDDLEFGAEKANLLNRASVHTAEDYWHRLDGGNLSYDQQMQIFRSKWAEAGRNRYQSLLQVGSSDEFKDEKAAREVAYLAKIGIDLRNFDESAVQEFYDKYLDNGRDLMGFIDDLFYAEGVESEVLEHLDAIKFISGMFDRETAMDIEGILVASDNLEEFREKAISSPRVTNQAERDRLRMLSRLMSSKPNTVQQEFVVKKTPSEPAKKPPDEPTSKPPTRPIDGGKKSVSRVEVVVPAGKSDDKPTHGKGGDRGVAQPPKDKGGSKATAGPERVIKADSAGTRGVDERREDGGSSPAVKPVVSEAGARTVGAGGDGGRRSRDRGEEHVVAEVDGVRLVSPAPPPSEGGKVKKNEAETRAEARRDGFRLAIPEDLIQIEDSIEDAEHVHVHPQAFVIPDTHGLGADGIVKRIREMAGERANVEYDPSSGKVTVNGQEAHIYGLGDMFDLNKFVNRKMFPNEKMLEDAASDPRHSLHAQARDALEQIQNNTEERAKYKKHWDEMTDYSLATGLSFWKDRIEKGEVVLGNHELMMLAGLLGGDEVLVRWLHPQNYSDLTYRYFSGQNADMVARNALRQAGVDLNKFTVDGFSSLNQTKYSVNGREVDLTADMARELRKFFLNSERGSKLVQLLLKNFKLYNVVNGVLLTHAGIPIDENGNLIAPESVIPNDIGVDLGKNEFEAAIKGKKGVALYDAIEKMVRNFEPGYEYAVLYLGYGSGSNNSPVFMREGFQNTMNQNGEHVLSQLNDQMKWKGGPKITRIMVGHTSSNEGQMWGPMLLGADDRRGSAVRLDLLAQDVELAEGRKINFFKVEVGSRHNFGQKDTIQSALEPA